MNPRQKSYDSYDKTIKLLKLTNSYYHFRNLESIKHRSPQYTIRPLCFSPIKKNKHFNAFQIYNLKKQNQKIKYKIKKILLKPTKPKMNDNFLMKDKKLKQFKKYQSNMYNKKIEKDNQNFKKRLYNQKAFLNSKMLDKIYSIEHSKSLLKLRKFAEFKNSLLPSIKSSYDNMSFLDFVKNFNIESNRSGRDEDVFSEKIKRQYYHSLSNTHYDYKKDSGNNSINK